MGISAVSSPGDLAVALPPGFDVPLGTYHMGDPAFRFPWRGVGKPCKQLWLL